MRPYTSARYMSSRHPGLSHETVSSPTTFQRCRIPSSATMWPTTIAARTTYENRSYRRIGTHGAHRRSRKSWPCWQLVD